MNTLHLICNAHLDPAWLWEWEEGATRAGRFFISVTIRAIVRTHDG